MWGSQKEQIFVVNCYKAQRKWKKIYMYSLNWHLSGLAKVYHHLGPCSFQAFRGHLKHSVGVSLHLHSSVMITKGQTTTKQKNKTKEEGGKKESRLMISLHNSWLDKACAIHSLKGPLVYFCFYLAVTLVCVFLKLREYVWSLEHVKWLRYVYNCNIQLS